MIQSTDIECLILGSGASTRFGAQKLLHRLENGIPILAQTIGIYTQVFAAVKVVVREGDDELVSLVEKEGAACIVNRDFNQGLSKSIVAGIENSNPSKAWLIALGDMPYVSVDTVKRLTALASEESIVVPRTSKGNGNPVVLGKAFRHDLIKLEGDIGAKPLLTRYFDAVYFYQCDDLGVHQDIDRPSDIR